MTESTISSTSAAISALPPNTEPPGPKPSRPGPRSPAWPLGHRPSCDRPSCALSRPEPIKLTVPARQYCGQLGKQDNYQVAVTLSLANRTASLPVAYRLYLPQEWADDPARHQKAGVPEEITFQTKPEIALDQIRAAADGALWRGGLARRRRC